MIYTLRATRTRRDKDKREEKYASTSENENATVRDEEKREVVGNKCSHIACNEWSRDIQKLTWMHIRYIEQPRTHKQN
jgi:hypothetical protein